MYKGITEPSPCSTRGTQLLLTKIPTQTQRECPRFRRDSGQLESLGCPQDPSLLWPIALCISASFWSTAGGIPPLRGWRQSPNLTSSQLGNLNRRCLLSATVWVSGPAHVDQPVSREWPRPKSCAHLWPRRRAGTVLAKGNSSILLHPRAPDGQCCYEPQNSAIPSSGKRSGVP